jgi:hypothetical protein
MDQDRLRLYGLILNVVIIAAAFAATAFPVLYAFSTWHKSTLGRVMMANSIATAFLIDMAVAQRFKVFGIEPSFIIYLVAFTFFASTKTAMSVMMWRINHRKDTKDERVPGGARGSSGNTQLLAFGEVVQHPEMDHPDSPAGSSDVLSDDR